MFVLTEEQKELSRTYYNNKVITCVIAPFHTSKTICEVDTTSTYIVIYPENECSIKEQKLFITSLLDSDKDEICIITNSLYIIQDMVSQELVRVLKEDGNLVPCPIKPLRVNFYDIIFNIFQNTDYQNDISSIEDFGTNLVRKVISEVESKKPVKDPILLQTINLIGDEVISHKLNSMI